MLGGIDEVRPAPVVLVDYPGFNLRLAKALRRRRFPGKILYYISPQVWAWNRGCIAEMGRFLDLMICVFPFEKPMYEASGLHTVFAGHPLLESLAREKTEGPRDDRLLGLFPGSREREVKRIFPIMVEACRLVLRQRPDVRFEAAAASEAHAHRMQQMAGDDPIVIRSGTAHDLMQRACAGIVCSGRPPSKLPTLVSPIAWSIVSPGLPSSGRRLVDVDCLGIINILNNYKQNPPEDPRLPARPAPHLVREFIQHFATPEALSEEAPPDERPRARSHLVASVSDDVATLEAEGAAIRAA
jgi:lipid-A-disaccharide synthase